MWLDVIKTRRKEKGLSIKQLSEMTNLPERSIARIFNGETSNPYMTTLIPIVDALDLSLDSVFLDSKVVVATETVVELKESVETVSSEKDLLLAENKILQDKVNVLTQELELTKMKLMHKEELLAVHNYYTKIKCE